MLVTHFLSTTLKKLGISGIQKKTTAPDESFLSCHHALA